MNDQLYGQPEPFDPAAYAQPPRRPVPRPRRLVVPVVLGIALVLGGFAGGYVLANATGSRTGGGSQAFGNGNFGNGGFDNGGPPASGRPRNGFGGGAAGTVGSVSSDQMTITTQAGGSRIVLLTPTTTVTEVSAATKVLSDLASGQTVTVIGTSNPDGSVTATQVIIGDIGALGGFGRGFGGDRPNASPAPGSAS